VSTTYCVYYLLGLPTVSTLVQPAKAHHLLCPTTYCVYYLLCPTTYCVYYLLCLLPTVSTYCVYPSTACKGTLPTMPTTYCVYYLLCLPTVSTLVQPAKAHHLLCPTLLCLLPTVSTYCVYPSTACKGTLPTVPATYCVYPSTACKGTLPTVYYLLCLP
jgi:hypothetical protein